MTPDLDLIEQVFLAVSEAAEEPWPPDRWLGALARADFALARARALTRELDRKITELVALRKMLDDVQGEARELVEVIDGWCEIALALESVAAQAEASSLHPALRRAMGGFDDGPEDVVRQSEDPHAG